MSCLKRQSLERDAGKKILTSMIYRGNMKLNSKHQEDIDGDMMGSEELGDLSMNLNTSFE